MDAREDSYIQELAARIEALDQLHQAVVDFSQQFSLDPLIDRIEALEEGSTEQAESNRFCTDAIVARIETLEAAQQPQQSVPKWHRLSEREPQVGDRCIYQCPPNLLHAFGTWHDTSTEHISRKGFWNNERGLFVGDPECISWRLAMPHEIPPQPQPDHLRNATKMVDTGWRNLHDLSPIMEPAPATEESSATAPPAPAGGLIDRLSHLLANRFSESSPGTDCTPLARDVLREIAKWLRSDGPDWPSVASLLEQEANQ